MSCSILHVNLKSTGEDTRGQTLECTEHLESIACTQLHAGNNINCKVISILSFSFLEAWLETIEVLKDLTVLDVYCKSEDGSTF